MMTIYNLFGLSSAVSYGSPHRILSGTPIQVPGRPGVPYPCGFSTILASTTVTGVTVIHGAPGGWLPETERQAEPFGDSREGEEPDNSN